MGGGLGTGAGMAASGILSDATRASCMHVACKRECTKTETDTCCIPKDYICTALSLYIQYNKCIKFMYDFVQIHSRYDSSERLVTLLMKGFFFDLRLALHIH